MAALADTALPALAEQVEAEQERLEYPWLELPEHQILAVEAVAAAEKAHQTLGLLAEVLEVRE